MTHSGKRGTFVQKFEIELVVVCESQQWKENNRASHASAHFYPQKHLEGFYDADAKKGGVTIQICIMTSQPRPNIQYLPLT